MVLFMPIMVMGVFSTRFCPDALPVTYQVVPSDIHGKLEYCVGVYQPGYKMASATTIVSPNSTCGADKAQLTKLAGSMSQASKAEVDACHNRTTWESLVELYHRWFD